MLKNIPPYLLVTASAWGNRIITAGVQLVSIRLLLQGLGTEQYAIYLLLVSLAGWYGLLEFGLSASLQNFVAEQRAKAESYAAFIQATAVLAFPLLAISVGVLYLTAPLVAPILLKQSTELSTDEKTRIFFMSGVLFVGGTVGSIVYKLWYAEQKGYLSNLFPAIASLLSLGGIWLVMSTPLEGKLIWSLLAFNLPPAVLSLLALVRTIGYSKIGNGVFSVLSPLLRRAFKFWVFSFMATATLQIDYLIMSQLLTPQDVVVYSITTRIFGIGYFLFSAVLAALWSSCTELMVQRRWNEVKHIIKRNLTVGLIGMLVFTGVVALSMPWVLKIVTPQNSALHIPMRFILLVGLYQLIVIWVSVFSMVLQSASFLRVFLVWTPVQMLVSAIGQWWLAQHYGIYGIVYGLFISYVAVPVWLLPLTLGKYIKKQMLCE